MRHPLRHLLFAGLLFLASGTLLRASSASSDQHAVEAALKKHVHVGVTEAASVIKRFGQPTSREPLRGPGESELLGYNHQVVVPSHFPLLPLISFPSHTPADTFFEITNGVVSRYWTVM